jgi:cytochrome P450
LHFLFWYLLHHPDALATLQKELDDALPPDSNPTKVYSYAEASRLPYLDACLKETHRIEVRVATHPKT